MIYYPISDWSMFNLGCTVLTGQAKLSEAEEFAPDMVLPHFADALRNPRSRAAHSEKLPPLRHRPPRAGRQLDHGRGDAARRRRASDGAVHRARRGDGAGGRDLPRRRAPTNATAISPSAFQRYQDIRIVRTARVQISSLMMISSITPRASSGRCATRCSRAARRRNIYDRLAWLYTPPPYVK